MRRLVTLLDFPPSLCDLSMEPLKSTRHAELLKNPVFQGMPADVRDSFFDIPIQECFGQAGQRMRFEISKLKPGSVS